MICRRLPVILFSALLAVPAAAGELVVFTDGRTLEVEGWQATGEHAELTLEGGGLVLVPLERIADVITRRPPRPREPEAPEAPAADVWRQSAGDYADLIDSTARRHGLEPALLAAVAQVESDFDPLALSHKGACGILQLLPETADRFGVENIFDVEENLNGGARYLSWLLRRYEGQLELALAAYNAGENAVDRHGGIPPYAETRAYVTRVLGKLR